MTKSELRTKYKITRNNINEIDATNKSNSILDNLIKTNLLVECNSIFTYLSYGREVSTDKFINYLFSNNKTVLIPKCDVFTETMIPVVYNISDKTSKNVYGIKENNSLIEYNKKIDIVIVPGICFDRFGNRIGHGKGYYDKFFNNNTILKVGLCYDECLYDKKIPCSTNDIAMDYVITDREVIKIKI